METATLSAVVLIASAISGALGMGGGTLLVATMAWLLPPAVVVPLHGVVHVTSNTTRGMILLRAVRSPLFAMYVPKQLVGVAVATIWIGGADFGWFRPALGAFMVAAAAWDRLRPARLRTPDAFRTGFRVVLVPLGLRLLLDPWL